MAEYPKYKYFRGDLTYRIVVTSQRHEELIGENWIDEPLQSPPQIQGMEEITPVPRRGRPPKQKEAVH